jgi:hypothetical protein
MTREEFNKLPKQEKIDLVFDKFISLLRTKDNPTRNITYEYARLNDDSDWLLVGERSTQNDFFDKTIREFFSTSDFYAITPCIYYEKKGFAKYPTRDSQPIYIDNSNIPDDFLEFMMFAELPNGTIEHRYLDKFEGMARLFPQMVYDMSKTIPMDLGDYIKLSQKIGRWATKKDVKKNNKNIQNEKSTFGKSLLARCKRFIVKTARGLRNVSYTSSEM